MSGEHVTPPKAKRRWGQFGLRTLFMLTTLAAICVGLFAARLERAKRQAAAVSRVRALSGGSIGYEFGGRSRFGPCGQKTLFISEGSNSTIYFPPVSRVCTSFIPLWLERRLGVDFFGDVVEVRTWNYIGRDEDLADFKLLPRLRQIDLICAAQVTDEGLVHLAKLRHLEYVRLGGSRTTDEGLARLREALPNCKVER